MGTRDERDGDVFDALAGTYDEARRRLIPCFDAFYGTAVQVAAPPLRAALAAGRTPEVLDLGAGTGLLSLLLSAAVPGVRLTLVDGAPAMLARAGADQFDARSVPHRRSGPTWPTSCRGRSTRWSALWPSTTWTTPASATLYRRAAAALAPGGVFVNAEQVAGPTPELDRRYDEVWLERITELGASPDEIAGSLERMRHDRPATVADQCRWLAEAGLVDVDCYFKEWRFAVFGGRAG